MATITLPTIYADGTIPTAAQFNGNFNAVVNEVNGGLSDANLSASAAIDVTKVAGTAATTTTAQTITGVKTFGVATKSTLKTDDDAATITFDMNVANIHTVVLGGNRTLAVSNVATGQVFIVRLVQDGTGSRTVTWWGTMKWPDATAPTLSTVANKVDTFGFICTGSGTYDGYIIGQNLG